MSDAKPPVTPRLHPIKDVEQALYSEDVWSPIVRETMAWLACNDAWEWFYSISELAGMEASILIDAEDKCYVDWGTISRVGLRPPAGAIIPFQVWTHTHPRGNSYWSYTDRQTLSIASAAKILTKAIVLGRREIKVSKWSETPSDDGLSSSGPLAHWSAEDATDLIGTPSPWDIEVIQ